MKNEHKALNLTEREIEHSQARSVNKGPQITSYHLKKFNYTQLLQVFNTEQVDIYLTA